MVITVAIYMYVASALSVTRKSPIIWPFQTVLYYMVWLFFDIFYCADFVLLFQLAFIV